MKKKDRILSREELLVLDIETYNKALILSAKQEGHTGDLTTCKYCKRLYSICCICDEAEKRWQNMVDEVREVSEMRNQERNFSSRDADLFGEDRLNDALVIGRLTRERDDWKEACLLLANAFEEDRLGNHFKAQIKIEGANFIMKRYTDYQLVG